MAYATDKDAVALLESLGIDTKDLAQCDIKFRPNDVVKAECTYYIKLGLLTKTLELHVKKEEKQDA